MINMSVLLSIISIANAYRLLYARAQHRIERNSSYAHRSLRLPANADLNKLDAKADNGVLHIRIDKIPQQQATQSRRAITVL